MSISLTNYVDIFSGQGAGIASPTRDLFGRCFTGNSLLPPGSFIQFSNAADVGTYFGLASEEYARAVFYFGFVSKNLVQAAAIQFSRWVQPYISIQSGTVTSTMDTVTGLTSTAGLTVGSLIVGTGIPANTVIESITSATALVMSNNSTVTGTESLTFSNTGVAPRIFSIQQNNSVLANWTGIANGSFILTIAGVSNTLSGLDFTGAGSLAAVATIIKNAIQANVGSGVMWANATVAFSSTGYSNSGFIFTGGSQIVASISVTAGGGGTDITGAGLLGWVPAITIGVNSGLIGNSGQAIWSPGALIETITQTLNTSVNNSTNFGSFLFLNNLNLTLAQVREAATWNITSPINVNYLYCIAVSLANYAAWSAVSSTAVGGIGSCCMTLQSNPFTLTGSVTSASSSVTGLQNTNGITVGMSISGTNIPAGTTVATINTTANSLTMSANATGTGIEVITFYPFEFPEQLPMMIEAATNYAALNSVQNYMFQIDNTSSLTPSVTTDVLAAALDAVFVNYYGSTQTAGTILSFYQRGAMMGQNIPSNIPDITSYVNEIWFKDAAGAAIMTLLLALNQIAANRQGEVQILGALQGVINQAVNNGTISVGKTLTSAQITYITSASGDSKAWYQVQNLGYWVNCVIQPNLSRPGEFEAVYTLIYSKDDTIRFVSGTQTLI